MIQTSRTPSLVGGPEGFNMDSIKSIQQDAFKSSSHHQGNEAASSDVFDDT
jgi:hypothetical protein